MATVIAHENSYLAAFDKQSGQLHWKVQQHYKTPNEGDHSYATPLVIRQQGRETIVVLGGEHLDAHDVADGKLLWSCGDFNPDAKPNWVPVASAVPAGDLAIVPYARGTRLHGIRLGGSGDVTATNRRWLRDDIGSFVPTPAVLDGKIYLLRDAARWSVSTRPAARRCGAGRSRGEHELLCLAAGGRRTDVRGPRGRHRVRGPRGRRL